MSKWDKICENCDNLDTSDKSTWLATKYFCTYYRTYQYLDDDACGHFDNKYGWYITTAFCHIKGYEDENDMLEILKNFRDWYMIDEPKYQDFLDEYGLIGPVIASKLEKDDSKEEVALIM